jgi:hypothetical protein
VVSGLLYPPKTGSGPAIEAARWSKATGWLGLGDFEGGRSFSRAGGLSADGSTVIGWGYEPPSSQGGRGHEPFIWDAVHGRRNLTDVLRNEYGLGESLAGWDLGAAGYVSADGRTFIGSGQNPKGNQQHWIAHLGASSAR